MMATRLIGISDNVISGDMDLVIEEQELSDTYNLGNHEETTATDSEPRM